VVVGKELLAHRVMALATKDLKLMF